MKSSTLLRYARRYIRDCTASHLCCAIHFATQELRTGVAADKSYALIGRIMRSIYPRASASFWLYTVLAPKQDFTEWRELHANDLRKWRLRWIDALIAEYEAKGD